MIAVVWQFLVKPGREREFERLHGADGEWTALARRSRSFIGSSFLRAVVEPQHYLVVEYWSEMVVYEKHQADFGDEITSLEAQREEMVEAVTPLGLFNTLDTPDRFGPAWSRRRGL